MKNGVVYFITDGDQAIKIGYSANPERRMSDLAGASSRGLSLLGHAPGTITQEHALHDELAEYRLKGEWFRDCDAVRATIDRVLDEGLPRGEFKNNRAKKQPTDARRRAQSLAELIIKYSFHGSAPHSFPGLRPRLLVEMRYRPWSDVYIDDHLSLLSCALQTIDKLQAELVSERASVVAAIEEFAAKRQRLDWSEAEMLRLQAALGETRTEVNSSGEGA